ncbi:MAG: phosphotransferase family protein [Actinomycetes bacterium]
MAPTREQLHRAFGPSVTPLGGGYSGETFLADVDGDEVVLRVYGRTPARAAVDVGLLRRLRGVVPVPAVLDARVDAGGDFPPYVLMSRLPGERLDEVLLRVGEREAAELGRAVGGVLLRLSTVRFDRPGELSGADLAVTPMPAELASLEQFVAARTDKGGLPDWDEEDRTALVSLARGVRPLLDAVAGESTLVHSDFNPKNLLVDVERAEVTGLLDWEFAYAGCRLADLGNLLRFPPEEDDEPGHAFVVGVFEISEAAGLPAGWLDTARALDLFALVDLAARKQVNPVVERAREVLLATARTGSLAAGRRAVH